MFHHNTNSANMNLSSDHRQSANDESDRFDDERHSVVDVERSAERLASVTGRLMTFLQTNIDQLQDVAEELAHSAQRCAEMEEAARDLESRRVGWEREQKLEAERIAEETRLLMNAWDQIEAERRERLTANCAETGLASERPEVTPAQSPRSLSDTDLFDLGVPRSSQQAAMQFQQIKREINNHARRNR